MCKSAAEGGQRCAAHTKAKFDKASQKFSDVVEHGIGKNFYRDYRTAEQAWEDAAIEYASTPQGEKEIGKLLSDSRVTGSVFQEQRFTHIINQGRNLREANKVVAETNKTQSRRYFHPLNEPVGLNVTDTRNRNYVLGKKGFVRTNPDGTTTRISQQDMNDMIMRGCTFRVTHVPDQTVYEKSMTGTRQEWRCGTVSWPSEAVAREHSLSSGSPLSSRNVRTTTDYSSWVPVDPTQPVGNESLGPNEGREWRCGETSWPSETTAREHSLSSGASLSSRRFRRVKEFDAWESDLVTV